VTARVIGRTAWSLRLRPRRVTLLGYFSTLGFPRLTPALRTGLPRQGGWALVRGVNPVFAAPCGGRAISVVLIGAAGSSPCTAPCDPSSLFVPPRLAAVPLLALHLIGASVVRAFGGNRSGSRAGTSCRDSLLLAIVAAAFWATYTVSIATLALAGTLLGSLIMVG